MQEDAVVTLLKRLPPAPTPPPQTWRYKGINVSLHIHMQFYGRLKSIVVCGAFKDATLPRLDRNITSEFNPGRKYISSKTLTDQPISRIYLFYECQRWRMASRKSTSLNPFSIICLSRLSPSHSVSPVLCVMVASLSLSVFLVWSLMVNSAELLLCGSEFTV